MDEEKSYWQIISEEYGKKVYGLLAIMGVVELISFFVLIPEGWSILTSSEGLMMIVGIVIWGVGIVLFLAGFVFFSMIINTPEK